MPYRRLKQVECGFNLQHVRDEHTSGSDEMGVKSDLGAVLRGPQCILMFVDFLKLVRFRGPLPHTLLSVARADHHLYFADELHLLNQFLKYY